MLRILIVAASLFAFTGVAMAADTAATPSACVSLKDKKACKADKTCKWHNQACEAKK